jgi:DNA-binding NtrC family response regulator
VEEGKFREDLYYRLNVFAIDTPPLRARRDDILLLANHYLKMYASPAQYNKKVAGFTSDGEKALVQYDWPGNIRELMNVINRGLILCKDSRLSSIHLGLFPTDEIPEKSTMDVNPENSLETVLERIVDSCMTDVVELPPLGVWLEEYVIKNSLASNSEVLNRAAHSLGIPESTLRRKVSRLPQPPEARNPKITADLEIIPMILSDLIGRSRKRGQTVFNLASDALVRELEKRQLSKKEASSLMGVSLPTYRRMVAEVPED